MLVASVSETPDGIALPAEASWTLTTAIGSSFHRSLYARLSGLDSADGVRVLPAATSLRAAFAPLIYDAASAAAAGDTLTDGGDGSVFVNLSGMRHTLSVDLVTPTLGSYVAELYRVDGVRRASAPTVYAMVQSGTATFADAFVDMRFALGLRDSTGNAVPLTRSSVRALLVRSEPGTPRIWLSAVQPVGQLAPVGSAGLVWPDPDQPGASGIFDVTTRLVRELDRLLGGLVPPLPPFLDLRLEIESASPCDLSIARFQIGYHLVRNAFPTDADGTRPDKQVLRFGDAITTQHSVDIDLPRAANVGPAVLRAMLSLRADRPQVEVAPTTDVALPRLTEGVLLEPECLAAQPVRLTEALSASGVSLGVLALAPGTRVRVELQSDWHGRPSGKTLAGGGVDVSVAGQRVWAGAIFDTPLVLTTEPHWLLVGSTGGSAVWLCAPGDGDLKLLHLDPDGALTDRNALSGYIPQYRYLSRVETAADRAIESACVVSIGQHTLAADEPAFDERQYDVSAALASYLATQPAAPGTVRIPLTLTVSTAGLVTVYPPNIWYELPLD